MLKDCSTRKRGFRGISLAATAALQVLLVVCVVPIWAAEGTGGSHVPSSEASLLGEFELEGFAFNREEIRAGGPGKDGIPALLNPETVPAARAGFLRPGDRVVAVSIGEESRAYPIRILNWHEAINDTVGGVPIAVVYCPLCDSVSVVDRRITNDKTLEFGISGLLLNSNVLLYDRTDQALWSQVGLMAVSGPHVGKSLKHLPWQILSFGRWRIDHPEGTVITLKTGHRRDYRRNPYADYFATERLMFPVSREDVRLPPKARVIGVKLGAVTKAKSTSWISPRPS